MAIRSDREAATLMDRVALAFLSGASALVLGALLWGGLLLGFHHAPAPFAWVGLFSAVMAVLGFVLLENFVGNWVGSFARWVLDAFRVIGP